MIFGGVCSQPNALSYKQVDENNIRWVDEANILKISQRAHLY